MMVLFTLVLLYSVDYHGQTFNWVTTHVVCCELSNMPLPSPNSSACVCHECYAVNNFYQLMYCGIFIQNSNS